MEGIIAFEAKNALVCVAKSIFMRKSDSRCFVIRDDLFSLTSEGSKISSTVSRFERFVIIQCVSEQSDLS